MKIPYNPNKFHKFQQPPPVAVSDYTLYQRQFVSDNSMAYRYRDVNVIDLQLDVPDRSTMDWGIEEEEEGVNDSPVVDENAGYMQYSNSREYFDTQAYQQQQQQQRQSYNRPMSGRR
jgi:NADP-dependent 3-hydroxy acid dehydrogenase YdfG